LQAGFARDDPEMLSNLLRIGAVHPVMLIKK
jgi:hypothetical protein